MVVEGHGSPGYGKVRTLRRDEEQDAPREGTRSPPGEARQLWVLAAALALLGVITILAKGTSGDSSMAILGGTAETNNIKNQIIYQGIEPKTSATQLHAEQNGLTRIAQARMPMAQHEQPHDHYPHVYESDPAPTTSTQTAPAVYSPSPSVSTEPSTAYSPSPSASPEHDTPTAPTPAAYKGLADSTEGAGDSARGKNWRRLEQVCFREDAPADVVDDPADIDLLLDGIDPDNPWEASGTGADLLLGDIDLLLDGVDFDNFWDVSGPEDGLSLGVEWSGPADFAAALEAGTDTLAPFNNIPGAVTDTLPDPPPSDNAPLGALPADHEYDDIADLHRLLEANNAMAAADARVLINNSKGGFGIVEIDNRGRDRPGYGHSSPFYTLATRMLGRRSPCYSYLDFRRRLEKAAQLKEEAEALAQTPDPNPWPTMAQASASTSTMPLDPPPPMASESTTASAFASPDSPLWEPPAAGVSDLFEGGDSDSGDYLGYEDYGDSDSSDDEEDVETGGKRKSVSWHEDLVMSRPRPKRARPDTPYPA